MVERMSGTDTQVEILLVEDNPVDVRMVLRATRDTSLADHVSVATDGQMALQHLRRQNGSAHAARPDLVLLDLNLPGISGLDVLTEMKADSELQDIPVVVLTSSALEEDIQETYRRQAAAFVTKPLGLDGFNKLINAIENFWAGIVTFA